MGQHGNDPAARVNGRLPGTAPLVLPTSTAPVRAGETGDDSPAPCGDEEAAPPLTEATYLALIEHLPGVAYIGGLDPLAPPFFVSPQVEIMFGVSADAWRSDPRLWSEAIHPLDRDRVLSDLSPARLQRAAVTTEYRAHAADGRLLWVRHRASLVQGRAERPFVVGFVLDITAHRRAEEALAYQALHDALTGLANRVLLTDRLLHAIQVAQRAQTRFAVLLLDLDRFKEVNDTLGHHVGDLLLQQVAGRVQTVLRTSDTMARLGGDEFAVLLPQVADPAGAHLVTRRILDALAPPVLVEGLSLQARASVGIVLYPDHGTDPPQLLQHADVAMYVAKRNGENVALYSNDADQYSSDRLALLTTLRPAIEEGQLRLHYQPQLGLTRHQVSGVEALVRWQHPSLGLMPPDQFLPLAEQAGLIKAVTLWTLDTGLRQSQAWAAAGLQLDMSINLSSRLLQDTLLPPVIARMLETYGLPASCLTLEISERVLMADPDGARAILARLNNIGVRLSIDDFGTGHASATYLEQLPVHQLTIDRSFIRRLAMGDNASTVVTAIVSLAHSLGLQVVAKGAETLQVCDLLTALGCDVVQGYYVSHPLPAQELERWLLDIPRVLRLLESEPR